MYYKGNTFISFIIANSLIMPPCKTQPIFTLSLSLPSRYIALAWQRNAGITRKGNVMATKAGRKKWPIAGPFKGFVTNPHPPGLGV